MGQPQIELNSSAQKKIDNDDTDSNPYEESGDIESIEAQNVEFQDIEKQPTGLFLEGDTEGRKICPITDFRGIKKNSMTERAMKVGDDKKKKRSLKTTVQRSQKTTVQKSSSSLTNLDHRKKNTLNKENKKLCISDQARVTRSRATKSSRYLMDSNNYFAIQSEKSTTSSNTLSKLKKQDEKKLQELLKVSNHIPKAHQDAIKTNYNSLKSSYHEWVQIMEEGFNVLLYGLGSKRSLINDFQKEIIPDEPSLIINGFFPSLTIKEILDTIIVELLGLSPVSNQSECYDIIKNTMNNNPDDRIYLLIHNIDGEMLRSQKIQEILCRLASIPNVHILASIDHINAPLIWDNVMRLRFNFYWVEARTFLPYQAETSYESSLLIQKHGNLALLSVKNIFASLTKNAKQIFMILVKYQLENSRQNYSGMLFKDLLSASREDFIASTDQALRAQLTEFLDHKLVKSKRNYDGAECLIIPLDNGLLKQLQEQYSETS